MASVSVTVDGPIRYANLYDGTLIDYRKEPTEWSPTPVPSRGGKGSDYLLRGNTLGGVKAYATEQAKGIERTGDNKYIIDFGTNNTGRIYLPSVTIPAGDTIQVRPKC